MATCNDSIVSPPEHITKYGHVRAGANEVPHFFIAILILRRALTADQS